VSRYEVKSINKGDIDFVSIMREANVDQDTASMTGTNRGQSGTVAPLYLGRLVTGADKPRGMPQKVTLTVTR
jgi:hypothetical protein